MRSMTCNSALSRSAPGSGEPPGGSAPPGLVGVDPVVGPLCSALAVKEVDGDRSPARRDPVGALAEICRGSRRRLVEPRFERAAIRRVGLDRLEPVAHDKHARKIVVARALEVGLRAFPGQRSAFGREAIEHQSHERGRSYRTCGRGRRCSGCRCPGTTGDEGARGGDQADVANLLWLVVFEQLEVRRFQIGDRPASLVAHDHVNHDSRRCGTETLRIGRSDGRCGRRRWWLLLSLQVGRPGMEHCSDRTRKRKSNARGKAAEHRILQVSGAGGWPGQCVTTRSGAQ
jgi:hypothetical protein